MLLAVNSIAHLLVDAVCACTVFSCTGDISALILAYNTLAFSTQCLTGLAADRFFGFNARIEAAACAAVALGGLLPLPPMIKIIIVGLGNSVFHVCGGAETLFSSGGRAAPLGIFVAPGAIGLALGTMFPGTKALFGAALIVFALLVIFAAARTPRMLNIRPAADKTAPAWLPLLLLLAVAARAVGGTAADFPWKNTAALSLITVLCVFAGKAAGGFAMDTWGAKKTALISIPLAAVCVAFGSTYMLPSLFGQLLLNLTMPVTLWLIYLALPDSPGFAFGLAASTLWPGTLAGGMIKLTGAWQGALILVSLSFGLAAIFIAAKKLEKEGLMQ